MTIQPTTDVDVFEIVCEKSLYVIRTPIVEGTVEEEYVYTYNLNLRSPFSDIFSCHTLYCLRFRYRIKK